MSYCREMQEMKVDSEDRRKLVRRSVDGSIKWSVEECGSHGSVWTCYQPITAISREETPVLPLFFLTC